MADIFDLQKSDQVSAFYLVIQRIEKIMNDNTLATEDEKDSINKIYKKANSKNGGSRKIKKKKSIKKKKRKNKSNKKLYKNV